MLNMAKIRRDPRNTGKGISTLNGFTLIELLMAVAVLAIITSLALPSYRTIIEKRRVTSGAEQISAFLSAVQVEAVKRNESLAVRYMHADTDSWCLGMIPVAAGSTSNTPCDCTKPAGDAAACEVDGELRVFTNANLNHPDVFNAIGSGDGAFVYDHVRGLLVEPADVPSLEMLSSESNYALNVGVTATGQVRICSNGADKKVPGFSTCS